MIPVPAFPRAKHFFELTKQPAIIAVPGRHFLPGENEVYLATRVFIKTPRFCKYIYVAAIIVALYTGYTLNMDTSRLARLFPPGRLYPVFSRDFYSALPQEWGLKQLRIDKYNENSVSVVVDNREPLDIPPERLLALIDNNSTTGKLLEITLLPLQDGMAVVVGAIGGAVRRAIFFLDGDPNSLLGLLIGMITTILLLIALFMALQRLFFRLDTVISSFGNATFIYSIGFMAWVLALIGIVAGGFYPVIFVLQLPDSLSLFPRYAILAYSIILFPLPFAIFLALADVIKSILKGKLDHALVFLAAAVTSLAITPILAYSFVVLLVVVFAVIFGTMGIMAKLITEAMGSKD